MLKLESRADLQRLIDDEIEESLTLEYKDSSSLAKESKARDELCKDVSAFANSAGGQIVYGITEQDRKPIEIDSGSELTREWIEQVLDSNVQPRIEGLIITPVRISGRRHVYVVTVPQALVRAPHQARDKKYYKRQNFQSVPMEDYEIRDALRRATTPELFLSLSLVRGDNAPIEFGYEENTSKPVVLSVAIGNRARQPAFHTIVQLGFHRSIVIFSTGQFQASTRNRDDLRWFLRRISTPPDLPIFQEADMELTRGDLQLGFDFRLASGTAIHKLRIATLVQTPGQTFEGDWLLQVEGQHLRLLRAAVR
jgi:Putative DNA-binding domain